MSASPNLKALLADPNVTKIFHFARFDLAALYNAFGVMPQPVYCTKIASRLTRTYTDRHGLKSFDRVALFALSDGGRLEVVFHRVEAKQP